MFKDGVHQYIKKFNFPHLVSAVDRFKYINDTSEIGIDICVIISIVIVIIQYVTVLYKLSREFPKLDTFNINTYNNNNNDLFCANILEDQAQWRDKTKGLSKLVIVKQCVSRQWMDEEARRLRRIGSIKEIGFRRRRNETILPSDLTLAGSDVAATEKLVSACYTSYSTCIVLYKCTLMSG